jgi:hypothetical protein
MDSNTESNSTSTYEISSSLPEGWEDHRFITPSDLKLVLNETHAALSLEDRDHLQQQYTLLFQVLNKSFQKNFLTIYELIVQYLCTLGIDVRNPPQIMHELIEMRKQKEKEKEEKKLEKEKEENQDDFTQYFYPPKSIQFLCQLEEGEFDPQLKKEIIGNYTKDYKKLFSKKQTSLWVLSTGIEIYDDRWGVQIISEEGINKLSHLIEEEENETMDHTS